MSTIIEMPKLSDTMTVGTVVKWYKEVGDMVGNGDILAEIETDKATMELENFDDGILLQLLAQEGDEVEIGKPLAIIGEQGEEIPDLGLISPQEIKSEDERFRSMMHHPILARPSLLLPTHCRAQQTKRVR